MQEKEVLEEAAKHDLVVAKAALQKLVQCENAAEVLAKAVEGCSGPVITLALVEEIEESAESARKARQITVAHSAEYKPPAAEIEPRLRVLEERDVTGKSRCTGSVEDFANCFRDRFRRISSLLKGRMSQNGVTKISAVKSLASGRQSRVIGMVYEKRETKNGHVIIELEDEEDSVPVLVARDSPIKPKAAEVILDEVIAVDGAMSGSLFIAKEITWPEMPFAQPKLVEDDVSIAFVSDTHVGSKLFMQDQFQRFLNFLNGNGTREEQEIAGKIKYVAFAGDTVDGVGIYPSQEKELVTKDIYTQYEIFGEFMKKIPEHIEVIIIPGNHDAVRLAEPQPTLPPELVKNLSGLKNVHLTSNPGWAEVHGLKLVLYHGAGIHSLVGSLPILRGAYEAPEKAAVEMLRRRHLDPVYGEEPLAPEQRDYLVIDEPPDLLHFGDLHKNGYGTYRGTLIVNSGCWQARTEYQVKKGHHPTPCLLPIYNMKTGNLRVLDFNAEKITGT
ncbi:MAG: DNA-directed DNA polymerase II small subunit [Candidatus Micrarchaeota archaeon]